MILRTKTDSREVMRIDLTQTKNLIPIQRKAVGLIAVPIITYIFYNFLKEYPNPCKSLPQDWREACKRPLTERMQAECKLIIDSSF
jgi:hypothetical protein